VFGGLLGMIETQPTLADLDACYVSAYLRELGWNDQPVLNFQTEALGHEFRCPGSIVVFSCLTMRTLAPDGLDRRTPRTNRGRAWRSRDAAACEQTEQDMFWVDDVAVKARGFAARHREYALGAVVEAAHGSSSGLAVLAHPDPPIEANRSFDQSLFGPRSRRHGGGA
jgi:hypothetical protein